MSEVSGVSEYIMVLPRCRPLEQSWRDRVAIQKAKFPVGDTDSKHRLARAAAAFVGLADCSMISPETVI